MKVPKILTVLKLDVGGILVIAALNKSSAILIYVLTTYCLRIVTHVRYGTYRWYIKRRLDRIKFVFISIASFCIILYNSVLKVMELEVLNS
ncbi:hypothetical protein BH18THE2_BH18THE2_15670 [soil metagenome]